MSRTDYPCKSCGVPSGALCAGTTECESRGEDFEFKTFDKIARLFRDVVITEKMDGTNAQILVPADPGAPLLFGSRNRWVTPGKHTDNYDFARWGTENMESLRRLGPGRHYGEWWGVGIARRYNRADRTLSLFNTHVWTAEEIQARGLPANVTHVPVIYEGPLTGTVIQETINHLKDHGSLAAPGFMDPEGFVLYHKAGGRLFKWTTGGDGVSSPKRPSPIENP